VERLEELVADGTLEGCEVFIFTDNTTTEAAFCKGNSSSKHLYNLVLRLRELEMLGNLKLHVIHVAGTRMQAKGTDGTSHGDHSTGVIPPASCWEIWCSNMFLSTRAHWNWNRDCNLGSKNCGTRNDES
jgi:hypothetical protein